MQINKASLYNLYVFCFFSLYFTIIYISLNRVFSLDDHFFHIRFAEILREKGIKAFTDFQSIYYSRMGIGHEYFVYYNFLFYLAIIPFTFIKPLILGMKMYGVFVLASSFTVFYVFLKKISIKEPFLWTLLFLAALFQSGWLFRFTLARPFTLAPAILVIMLYFIYRKKYSITLVIAFFYFYWHTATFIFPFCLAFGYFIFEKFYGKRTDWKLIIYPFLGTLGAIIVVYLISPGAIRYLRDVIFPVFFDTTLSKKTGIIEGGEVYGRDFFSIVSPFFTFFAFFCIAGTYEILRYIREKQDLVEEEDTINQSERPLRAMLFMASLVFLFAATISSRFLDYFVVFCFLYVAISISNLVKFIKLEGALFRKSIKISIFVIFFYFFTTMSFSLYSSLSSSSSWLPVQEPARWLDSNLEKNKIIFNVDWDSFPVLYYYTGDKFRFATGLEPRFLYDLDHELYWKWFNVGKGLYCPKSDCSELESQRVTVLFKKENRQKWYDYEGDLIANSILTDFKTDIITTYASRKDLVDLMDNSNRFKKEFMDEKNSSIAIYRVLPEEK